MKYKSFSEPGADYRSLSLDKSIIDTGRLLVLRVL